jgi:hypothetical protein
VRWRRHLSCWVPRVKTTADRSEKQLLGGLVDVAVRMIVGASREETRVRRAVDLTRPAAERRATWSPFCQLSADERKGPISVGRNQLRCGPLLRRPLRQQRQLFLDD